MEAEQNREQRIVTLESNLERAALLGKQLLEQLSLKTSECDELVERLTRYEIEIDTLKQKVHTAERDFQLAVIREDDALKDIDCLKTICTKYETLQEEHRTLQETARLLELEKQRRSQNVTELEEHLLGIRTELSLAKNQIEELKIQARRRESIVHLHTNSTENDSEMDHTEELTLKLERSQTELENLRALLEQTMKEKELIYKKNLRNENKLEEKSSIEQELAFRLNIINEKNHQISELKGEIELLKAAETDPNRRGNSIFAEVEDRRLEVEAKLLEVQARFRAADESRRRLKTQLTQCYTSLRIMASHSSKADQNYVKTLEKEVIRLRTDLASLCTKVTASRSGDEIYTEKDLQNNPLTGMLLSGRRHVASLKRTIETLIKQEDQRSREILRLGSDLWDSQNQKERLENERKILLMKLKEEQTSVDISNDIPVSSPKAETIKEVLLDVVQENNRVKQNEAKLLASEKKEIGGRVGGNVATSVILEDGTSRETGEVKRSSSPKQPEQENLPVKVVNFGDNEKTQQPKQAQKRESRQVTIVKKTKSDVSDCKTQ